MITTAKWKGFGSMRVAGGGAPEWHIPLGAVQAAVLMLQLDIAGGHNTVMSRLNAGGFMVGFYSQCPDCLDSRQ